MYNNIIVRKLPGPKVVEKLREERGLISSSYLRPEDRPLYIVKGKGCYLEDLDGNVFLDLGAGIAVCSTGHCHPKITATISGQSSNLIHQVSGYGGFPSFTELVKRLVKTYPGNKEATVYFGNSGTEVIEGAIKLAKYKTGRHRFIAFTSSFHGRTLGALSLTASKSVQVDKYYPMLPGVTHVPYGNCGKCHYGKKPESCEVECIKYIENELFDKFLPASEVAAIFLEPVQGEGGYVIPDKKFFRALRELTSKYGILLVSDEIQSGVGRTGKFYAIEHFDIVPDMICIAKGIASGLPLGALLAPKEIMNWKPGSHGSTFGGNVVACAAAVTTLDLIEEELMENAVRMGNYFLENLKKIGSAFNFISEVRGLGLMLALEFNLDTPKNSADLRNKFLVECYKQGLLLLECGKSTVRICPPMIISQVEINEALQVIKNVLGSL